MRGSEGLRGRSRRAQSPARRGVAEARRRFSRFQRLSIEGGNPLPPLGGSIAAVPRLRIDGGTRVTRINQVPREAGAIRSEAARRLAVCGRQERRFGLPALVYWQAGRRRSGLSAGDRY